MPNKLWSAALVAPAIVVAALALHSPPQTPPAVILIAIDGLRPDYVIDAAKHGLRIPNLQRFVTEGAYAAGVKGVVPTVTYPSFTTVMTGTAPARHGIISNTTFDPLNGNAGGWYWYAEDIRVPTLWDAAAKAGFSTASVHWPVSVGANIRWNLPQIWRTGMPDDRKLVRALSTAGLVDSLEHWTGKPYADGIDESITGDENRALFTTEIMRRFKPRFLTAYFTAVDHEQHDRGPFTREAFAVLERIDGIVGRIAADAERIYGTDLVLGIVSDHGFERTNREVHLLSAFAADNLLTVRNDTIVDWQATAWAAGASAAIVLKDTTSTQLRTRVKVVLDRLAADSASGVARVIDGTELRRRGAFPAAAFLVDLKGGYQIGRRLRGPLVTDRAVGGMHGYLPENPNMQSSFLLRGRGIGKGVALGRIDLRDIAPTLADIMGLDLPTAEGKALPVMPARSYAP